MDEFVARRRREEAQREVAYAAGRERWSASTSSGQNLSAPRPADLVALGRQSAPAQAERPVAAERRRAYQQGGTWYGSLYAPPPEDVADLRRQQADFARTTREIDKQNSWLAIPALAPAGLALGLEGAAALAARFAAPALQRAPLVLEEGMPYLRVGDNWATRAGRRAHAALKARVDAKPGWDGEQGIVTKSGLRRPDVRAPARTPDPKMRHQLELKPNTPTGRQAGARAVERYTRDTGNKTRTIYYDPKDFI
jgi:hypothetical protein